MAVMQCGKCLVRWVFDKATKILSTAKAFDKILLTERTVKSKCKHISDLKTKPHPEQRHAEVNLMASQLENECVKRRKEKKRAERLANAEASGETLKSPKIEILATL